MDRNEVKAIIETISYVLSVMQSIVGTAVRLHRLLKDAADRDLTAEEIAEIQARREDATAALEAAITSLRRGE